MASQPDRPPLITHMYTADPSAHVFDDGRVYIYPSHDRESGIAFNDNGDQYDMADYHVFSMDSLDNLPPPPPPPSSSSAPSASAPPSGPPSHRYYYPPVTDHGPVLSTADVPWASRQLWAPDACRSPYADEQGNRKYYLFFPARDRRDDRFRIGVAVGDTPTGPFVADPLPIEGTYSVDPAVFVDYSPGPPASKTGLAVAAGGAGQEGEKGEEEEEEAKVYLYFGGLWGGQLQCYQALSPLASSSSSSSAHPPSENQNDDDGTPDPTIALFDPALSGPKEPSGPGVPALCPKVALLDRSLRRLAAPGGAQDLVILCPSTGLPIPADDHARRFFEAAWCHRRARTGWYYFSYSTGDTHRLCYAVSRDSATGPFTYGGVLMGDMGSGLGWTTHHSVVEWPRGSDRWWLFYHDCEMSGGTSHLRNVKYREVWYDEDGGMVLERPGTK